MQVGGDILARALGTTVRPAGRIPRFVGACQVAANVFPGGFERQPGCLAAAVYRVSPDEARGYRIPTPGLWLVVVSHGASGPEWLEGLVEAAARADA